MSIRAIELISLLREYGVRRVSGSGSTKISGVRRLPSAQWEAETLYILPAEEAIPGSPPTSSALIVMGTRTLPPELTSGGADVFVCPDAGEELGLLYRLCGMISYDLSISDAVLRIHEAMVRRRTLQAVLDAANQALDMPMVIADYTNTIFAHTCPPEIYGEADWDQLITKGVVPEFMGDNCSRILQNICETPGGTLRLTQCIKTGQYNLMGDVVFEGERIGRLAMGLPRGVPTARETHILAAMTELLASLIGSTPQTGFSRGDIMETFLTMLIEGGPAAESFFADRASEVNYPNNGLFRIIVMDLESHRPFRQSIRSIISYLEMICPGTITAVYGKTLVMLTNYQTRRAFEARSEAELDAFINDYSVFCGASREFSAMSGFASAYSEALSALEMSRYLNHPSPDGLRFRLTEYDACESLIEANALYKSGEDLLRRCHPYVLRLREYDAEYGSSYFETLKVYLKYAQKTQLTAEALCLHRNSLEYRLRKIKNITGLEWEDGDLIMRLTRSFIYLDFLEMAEGRASFLHTLGQPE